MRLYKNVRIFILFIFSLFISCNNNSESFDFLLVEEGSIVEDFGFSQGAAWADYDNDGDEDLFVTNSWTNGNNMFYENTGEGFFIKVENIALTNDGGNSNGCTWGDVDNDGDVDLFVANVDNQNNFFYLNNNDKTFSKNVLGDAVNNEDWSYTCAFADYNNDGWLDLFVGNYKEQNNVLYLNDKSGGLIRNEETVISAANKSTQGCAWFDFNNDGLIDLYVANNGLNDLYKNIGSGKFEIIENIIPVTENGNSFGCSTADYNNDGLIDIFVANWWGKNHLYKNLGKGQFEKIQKSPVTDESLNSEGSSWGDFDNDGDLDLIVTNDGDNSVFENNNGNFLKLENLSPASDSSNSNGVTWNDFDNDGYLDLFIANGGNQPNLLYRNPGNKNNWLKVKCIGKESNHSAIGTRVTVVRNENRIMREVASQTGGGYGGMNGLILHFGVGKEKPDSVIVNWPSGEKSKIINPKINKTHTIIEGN